MADSDRPRFNLRLTPELEALVHQSSRKNGRSKNAEILAALEWRYHRDPALEIAEAMRPLLDSLSEEQRGQLVEIVTDLARGAAKKRRR